MLALGPRKSYSGGLTLAPEALENFIFSMARPGLRRGKDVAGHSMSASALLEPRLNVPTDIFRIWASWMEGTSGRWIKRTRHLARQLDSFGESCSVQRRYR